ncbi:MAG: FAD-dependent thymidylate synthase [Bacillota bacterium]|nr:FAD-dependent thymidylate synthase [Bacillota bacterium]
MIIMQPQVLVPESELDAGIITRLERYARICYKSEDKMGESYSPGFLRTILSRGHESIIEHEKITVMFIVDRGITHEIVRHRIASYSQESTRYCNYSQDKFGREIAVIEPYFFRNRKDQFELWKEACQVAETNYLMLLEKGASPQEARSILPTCLKTEIAVTFNIREWRHFFALRCAAGAHPQMKQVAIPLLLLFQEKLPILFENIEYDQSFPVEEYAQVILTDEFLNQQ